MLLSKEKREKSPHRLLRIVMVCISLSDENTKILEIKLQKHLKNDNFLLKGNQTSV